MATIKEEERMIRWIFNSKDSDTLSMWLDILDCRNFKYPTTKLMLALMMDDWQKYDDYNLIIKEKGYDWYYNETHIRILKKFSNG